MLELKSFGNWQAICWYSLLILIYFFGACGIAAFGLFCDHAMGNQVLDEDKSCNISAKHEALVRDISLAIHHWSLLQLASEEYRIQNFGWWVVMG